MAYAVLQKKRFSRQYKKLNDNVSHDVDMAVAKIAEDPATGERKKVTLPICWFTNFTVRISSICLVTPSMMGYALFILKPLPHTKIFIVTSSANSAKIYSSIPSS